MLWAPRLGQTRDGAGGTSSLARTSDPVRRWPGKLATSPPILGWYIPGDGTVPPSAPCVCRSFPVHRGRSKSIYSGPFRLNLGSWSLSGTRSFWPPRFNRSACGPPNWARVDCTAGDRVRGPDRWPAKCGRDVRAGGALGDAPQIRIDQWKQFLESFRLAFLPLLERPSDVARFIHSVQP